MFEFLNLANNRPFVESLKKMLKEEFANDPDKTIGQYEKEYPDKIKDIKSNF